ncbi:hypothetical protein ACFQVC_28550 [Streptomyces monticola]|uniref:Uncharacterized protein n=1 Tax=Streptomyces monticola TaxID=2666263 RepID=A0ABW2JSD9_9ACTN
MMELLERQLERLVQDAPLAALNAVAALEGTVKSVACRAAADTEADGLSGEVVGRALGLSEAEARSRLLGHRLAR